MITINGWREGHLAIAAIRAIIRSSSSTHTARREEKIKGRRMEIYIKALA
jgi:hypothetical protein